MKLKATLFCLLLALCLLCACGETKEPIPETTTTPPPSGGLVDNDICSFELISFELDESGNYIWFVGIINKSVQPLTFSMDAVYLNEFRADPCWSLKMGAGESIEQEIIWPAETLAVGSLTVINRVDFRLTAFPSGDSSNLLLDEQVSAYPHGKAAFKSEAYSPAEGEQVLLDNETAQICLQAELQGDMSLRFYYRNKISTASYLTVTQLKVNGQEIGKDLWLLLHGEKQGITAAAWTQQELAALEIEAISGVTMQVAVCDAATDAVLWSDTVTLTP